MPYDAGKLIPMAIILHSSGGSKPLYRGKLVSWYVAGVLEVLLAFRFFLKLFAANPDAFFTRLIYVITYPFAAPFLNVFQVKQSEGSVLEVTTLLAMLVYWLLAWGISKLLVISKPVSEPEAAVKLSEEDTKGPITL